MNYLVIFFIIVIISVCLIIGTLVYIRMTVGRSINKPLLVQPFSTNFMSKNYLFSLIFLETPVILTAVIGISIYDLLLYSSSIIVQLLPSIYLLFFSISSAITIYYSGISLPHLFFSFGLHPQFESKFLMQFLLFNSFLGSYISKNKSFDS